MADNLKQAKVLEFDPDDGFDNPDVADKENPVKSGDRRHVGHPTQAQLKHSETEEARKRIAQGKTLQHSATSTEKKDPHGNVHHKA